MGPSGDNSPDVFDVAARDNGVTYDIACCGEGGQKAAGATLRMSFGALVLAMAFAVVYM